MDAVYTDDAPAEMDPDVGEMLTEVRYPPADEEIVTGSVPIMVPDPREAFTVTVARPGLLPATSLTLAPEVGLMLARELFTDHEYVIPVGQEPPRHVGVAVSAVWLPGARVGETGEMLTAVKVPCPADTMVMVEVAAAEWPPSEAVT